MQNAAKAVTGTVINLFRLGGQSSGGDGAASEEKSLQEQLCKFTSDLFKAHTGHTGKKKDSGEQRRAVQAAEAGISGLMSGDKAQEITDGLKLPVSPKRPDVLVYENIARYATFETIKTVFTAAGQPFIDLLVDNPLLVTKYINAINANQGLDDTTQQQLKSMVGISLDQQDQKQASAGAERRSTPSKDPATTTAPTGSPSPAPAPSVRASAVSLPSPSTASTPAAPSVSRPSSGSVPAGSPSPAPAPSARASAVSLPDPSVVPAAPSASRPSAGSLPTGSPSPAPAPSARASAAEAKKNEVLPFDATAFVAEIHELNSRADGRSAIKSEEARLIAQIESAQINELFVAINGSTAKSNGYFAFGALVYLSFPVAQAVLERVKGHVLEGRAREYIDTIISGYTTEGHFKNNQESKQKLLDLLPQHRAIIEQTLAEERLLEGRLGQLVYSPVTEAKEVELVTEINNLSETDFLGLFQNNAYKGKFLDEKEPVTYREALIRCHGYEVIDAVLTRLSSLRPNGYFNEFGVTNWTTRIRNNKQITDAAVKEGLIKRVELLLDIKGAQATPTRAANTSVANPVPVPRPSTLMDKPSNAAAPPRPSSGSADQKNTPPSVPDVNANLGSAGRNTGTSGVTPPPAIGKTSSPPIPQPIPAPDDKAGTDKKGRFGQILQILKNHFGQRHNIVRWIFGVAMVAFVLALVFSPLGPIVFGGLPVVGAALAVAAKWAAASVGGCFAAAGVAIAAGWVIGNIDRLFAHAVHFTIELGKWITSHIGKPLLHAALYLKAWAFGLKIESIDARGDVKFKAEPIHPVLRVLAGIALAIIGLPALVLGFLAEGFEQLRQMKWMHTLVMFYRGHPEKINEPSQGASDQKPLTFSQRVAQPGGWVGVLSHDTGCYVEETSKDMLRENVRGIQEAPSTPGSSGP